MIGFKDLGLPEVLLRGVEKLGFSAPMPIQAEAIPALLVEDAPDCVALAATGTGKTCAYGLPLLAHLNVGAAEVQGLILAPTRELCLQIGEELARFAKYMEGVHVVACYGGAPIGQQIVKLSRGAQVVVATPGRLCDLIRREAISLETVRTCVLDEADEMLNLGFREELSFILDGVPKDAAMWLFSATMPPEVDAIAKTYISDPLEITVGTKNETQANIVHHAYAVAEHNRYGALRRVIDFVPEMYGLVFCRTRVDTQRLSESLMHDGVYAEALHGDLSQAQRDGVMRKFREKAVRILVATDVAARGLDVEDISHVIHYHLPDDPAVYTHRSGRTARAGKSGISISLVTPREKHRLRLIERICGMRFEQRSIPTPEEVRQKHVFWLAEQVRNTTEIHPAILELLPAVSPMMAGLSSEEVLARILQMRLSMLMDAYKDAKDLNPAQRVVVDKAERDAAFGERQRIMIHVGRLDHLKEGAVVRLACEAAGIQASDIGAISIKREFAFFDVRAELGRRVLSALQNVDFDGRPLNPKKVDPVEDLHEKKPKKPFKKKFSEKREGKPFKKEGKGTFKKGEKSFKKGEKSFKKSEKSFKKGGKKGSGKGAQHA